MKSKKKFLLLGVGAMGVLAVGVGTTSTFAWFQASSRSGIVQVGTRDKDVSVADPGYSATAVDLPLNIRIDTASNKTLELTHYYAENALAAEHAPNGNAIGSHAAGFYKAFYQSAQESSIVYTNAVKDSNHEFYRVYTIFAVVEFPATNDPEVDQSANQPTSDLPKYWNNNGEVLWCDQNGDTWSEDEVIDGLDGQQIEFSVEPLGDNNRARFFGAGTNSNPAPAAGEASLSEVAGATLSNLGTESQVGYFGYYVEGERANGMDTGAVNGNFRVTVGPHD